MYNTHTEIPSGPIKYSRNPAMDLWGFARFQSTGEIWHLGVCGVLLFTSTRSDSTLEGEEKLGTGYLVSSCITALPLDTVCTVKATYYTSVSCGNFVICITQLLLVSVLVGFKLSLH